MRKTLRILGIFMLSGILSICTISLLNSSLAVTNFAATTGFVISLALAILILALSIRIARILALPVALGFLLPFTVVLDNRFPEFLPPRASQRRSELSQIHLYLRSQANPNYFPLTWFFQRDFDADVWKAEGSARLQSRLYMERDLLDSHFQTFQDANRRKVHALLGQPDWPMPQENTQVPRITLPDRDCYRLGWVSAVLYGICVDYDNDSVVRIGTKALVFQ